MSDSQIVNLIFFCVPTILTGLIALYFFKTFVKNEENRRNFLIQKDLKNETLPLRLQAYERLTLFLDRISLAKLIVRVEPISEDKQDYLNLLLATIDQEYNHNITQQIYVSNECWSVLLSCKNNTIQFIRKTTANTEVKTSSEMREFILQSLSEQKSPTELGMDYLKTEVSQIM